MLRTDPTSEVLLSTFDKTFNATFPELRLSIEKKEDFTIGKSLEEGAEMLLSIARAESLPWCVYVAPRLFELVANCEKQVKVYGIFVAIALNQAPVGLFVNTFSLEDLPRALAQAFTDKLARIRQAQLKLLPNEADMEAVERFRCAAEEGYMMLADR